MLIHHNSDLTLTLLHSSLSGQHKQKDIPGMLLFDSNLLCVDGFVNAHCLQKRKRERTFILGLFFSDVKD